MSKRGREIKDSVIAMLDRAGVNHGPVVYGGKHARLAVRLAGKSSKITLPVSPSDQRSQRNAEAQVLRLLRSAGIFAQRRAT